MQQNSSSGVQSLVCVGRNIDALHYLVRHDPEGPRIARVGDLNGGRASIEEWSLGLLHDWHHRQRRIRAFLANHYVWLILIEQTLRSLRRRQRAACRVFIVDVEFVAVYAGLIELVERKLDALLVLHAEVGTWAGNRKQPADLDDL